jgi:hypothetical protein
MTEQQYKRAVVAAWAIILLQAADVVSTIYGLSIGMVEINPIAQWAIDSFGTQGLAYLKIPVVLIMVFLSFGKPIFYWAAILLSCIPVVNNLFVLGQHLYR